MRIFSTMLLFFCFSATALAVLAATIQVGPERAIKLPSEAARIASDNDVIEIDAGEYRGDVAVWRQSGLVLRGVGGRAHLVADGAAAEEKAIWVVKGTNTTVENIEFSGASVPDQNGSGIRHEGEDLKISHCFFHDNENGILGGGGTVLVEYSEFARNGFGDGRSHNIYIGARTKRFTLRYSYTHHARIGHQIKSRAAENHIVYNRIMDEDDGNSSYLLDLPNGGMAYVIGNSMQQGRKTENYRVLAYAAEGLRSDNNGLYVVSNTMVNDFRTGIFVQNSAENVKVEIINNLVVGPGVLVQGLAYRRGNIVTRSPYFVNRDQYDFRTTRRSPGIDKGVESGSAGEVSLQPRNEYRHPLGRRPRHSDGRLDVGAFELTPR